MWISRPQQEIVQWSLEVYESPIVLEGAMVLLLPLRSVRLAQSLEMYVRLGRVTTGLAQLNWLSFKMMDWIRTIREV
jgi:hypothetical protein